MRLDVERLDLRKENALVDYAGIHPCVCVPEGDARVERIMTQMGKYVAFG